MADAIPTQLRFPTSAGFTIRAEFDGGAMSSDFGAILLRGTDLQIGLTSRLASAIDDKRHASYIDHSMVDLLRQRIFQTASGYADGNDSNTLRRDPMFKLAAGRAPLDEGSDLASGSTLSRLENSVSTKDIYRLAKSFVEAFISSYAQAPSVIVLDMDHSEDPTHGQQEFAFYNHHYGNYCYLPLFLFEGISGKLITAVLRPGKRPTGRENAAIIKRVLRLLRQAWPETHILLRGDGHFSNPELMALYEEDPYIDFLFGLAGNKVLSPKAEPLLEKARALHQTNCVNAKRLGLHAPEATRLYDDVVYQAGSWSKAYRVVVKAEVMAAGDNPRFVVTSLSDPSPELLYRDLYCARGQDENCIKAIKNDLASDRTSDHAFLANHLRLFYSCAAYVLIHSLRENTLVHTELAKAQPMSIILKLFKLAVRVVQYKDRIKLSLPSSYPMKGVLVRVTELLYLVLRPPAPA
ncbi:MAG: IS1380 family transposase [Comamonadaceae bacterium]|uniref:IS1380 family transposase n=1 Tax=Candidatus Skiveiella danica TaxID=3386177 RepID=UPI003909CF56|nr:IS1380 family transposase [Comamonadaceae bacterium]